MPAPKGAGADIPADETRDHDLPGAQPVFTTFEGQRGAEPALRPGQVLAERFEVHERIGVGGMGEVYAAFDRTLGKEVALKVIRAGLVANEAAREAFLREGRIACELSHPNIVNVYDVHVAGEARFLAMERLEGRTLREEIEDRRRRRQPFSLDFVRKLLGDLAAALGEAHRLTVHRDVKPENVFLCDDGSVKLMDFGIASALSRASGATASRGSPLYAAPELAGDPTAVDRRSDQYSLAAIGYELLTGQPPAGMARPVRELKPGVPRALAAAVERGLAGNANDRFADMAAFARAASSTDGSWQHWLRDPRALGAAAVGAAVLAGAVFLLLRPQVGLDTGDPRAEAIHAQGVSLALRERLDEARSALEKQARAAEGTPDAALMAEVARLAEQHVFGGEEALGLEGRLRVGNELIKSAEFEDAKLAFDEVRSTADELLARSRDIAGALRSQREAEQARASWQEGMAKRGWQSLPAAKAADASFEQGVLALGQGDFASARAALSAGTEGYAQAARDAPGIAASAAQERSAQARTAQLERAARKLVAVPAGASLGAFSIDATEVTVAEYQECVAAGACTAPARKDGCNSAARGSHPVNCVTWAQARRYCEFAEKRLPSDREWERAARGSDGRAYPWGNAPADCSRAVIGGCAGSTAPSGGRAAGRSPFGALDMAGNVAEWTNSQSLRGGDWLYSPEHARIDAVARPEPDQARTNAGIRCAR